MRKEQVSTARDFCIFLLKFLPYKAIKKKLKPHTHKRKKKNEFLYFVQSFYFHIYLYINLFNNYLLIVSMVPTPCKFLVSFLKRCRYFGTQKLFWTYPCPQKQGILLFVIMAIYYLKWPPCSSSYLSGYFYSNAQKVS